MPGLTVFDPKTGTRTEFAATDSMNGGEALNKALLQGGVPIDPGTGKAMSVSTANGGWLVGGQPLNYVYGQTYLPGQVAALPATGNTPNAPYVNTEQPVSWPKPPVPPTPPPAAPTYDPNKSLEDIIKGLIGNSLGRTSMTDYTYAQMMGDLYPRLLQRSTDYDTWRNDLMNQLLYGTPESPGMMTTLKDTLANRNKAVGLTDQTKAALQSQAMDQIPARYNAASSALKTELARRGAMGNQLPGSGGDILRGYEPLMQAREQDRAQAERAGIFANEEAMQQSLKQNQTNALSATNIMGGLTSTYGQIYDPNDVTRSLLGAGQLGINAASAGNELSGSVPGLVQALAGNQQAGLGQIALAALLSSVGQSVGSKIPDWLTGIFKGGGDPNQDDFWNSIISQGVQAGLPFIPGANVAQALATQKQYGPLGKGKAFGGTDAQFLNFQDMINFIKTKDKKYINPDWLKANGVTV